jgi:hypothetical protein
MLTVQIKKYVAAYTHAATGIPMDAEYGHPLPRYQGECAVYLPDGAALFQTWLEGGERHWQCIASAFTWVARTQQL